MLFKFRNQPDAGMSSLSRESCMTDAPNPADAKPCMPSVSSTRSSSAVEIVVVIVFNMAKGHEGDDAVVIRAGGCPCERAEDLRVGRGIPVSRAEERHPALLVEHMHVRAQSAECGTELGLDDNARAAQMTISRVMRSLMFGLWPGQTRNDWQSPDFEALRSLDREPRVAETSLDIDRTAVNDVREVKMHPVVDALRCRTTLLRSTHVHRYDGKP